MPTADAGFPAHAGMDLTYSAMSAISFMVSPPTRGWTLRARAGAAVGGGFPAHAGMDPGSPTTRLADVGFPAHAGMDPYGFAILSDILRFPAHAGMDPHGPAWRGGRRGFPRPRGDGPIREEWSGSITLVSPPTRGWTSLGAALLPWWFGFPAHAGMDPHGPFPRPFRRWFPRPRGDGPRTEDSKYESVPVSPPTRGWTSIKESRTHLCAGFPAHAGWTFSYSDFLTSSGIR